MVVCLAGLFGCGGGLALAPVTDAADLHARQSFGQVQPGDTLYAFAWRYGFDHRELAAWNGIGPPYRIAAGDLLLLGPGGRPALAPVEKRLPPPSVQVRAAHAPRPAPIPAAARPLPPIRSDPGIAAAPPKDRQEAAKPVERSTPVSPATEPAMDDGVWRWPLRGKLVQKFDPSSPGGQGVRIKGDRESPVHAARGGKVVYLGGGLPGYGRLIIVKHTEDLLTAYGYLGRTFVKEGDTVRGGEPIAVVSDGESGAILHFEVRRDGKSTDPLAYLSG